MCGRAVHHNTCLCRFCTAGSQLVTVRGEIQRFRAEEFVITGAGNRDGTRIMGRKEAAAHQRVSAAGNLVDGDCRPYARLGIQTDGEAACKIVETVVALGYSPYTAVRREILVLDDGVDVVINVIVAPGSGKRSCPVYGHSSPYPHGMDIPVSGCPHFGEARVDRGGSAVRNHLRFGILIHTVDGNAHSSRDLTSYRNISYGAHGVDFALGICGHSDRRMIGTGIAACVDVRVVQGCQAVLVDIRYGCRSLKVEDIFSPAHADTTAYGSDAGLFCSILFRHAVRCGN